ncbi:MAG: DMT family transporter [Xanthobacteraceae bacterium]
MTDLRDRAHRLVPGIAAGTTLGIADVLAKLVLAAGCDVLTMLSLRSLVGIAFMSAWLRIGPRAKADARVRSISLAIGIIFAGLIYCLFKAIAIIDVPTAVLTYFTYPLLTGLIAPLAGLDRLRWQGALCAAAAFVGLAIMIGAHPAGLAVIGIVYALGASCCRTIMLLITRAYLMNADARVVTWYSLISSTLVFLAASGAMHAWHAPQTNLGWLALVGMSVASTAAVLFVVVSTVRIGPFRTALIMNLEPLTAMILSAIVLAEVITPAQGFGSAIMLAALVAFQLTR